MFWKEWKRWLFPVLKSALQTSKHLGDNIQDQCCSSHMQKIKGTLQSECYMLYMTLSSFQLVSSLLTILNPCPFSHLTVYLCPLRFPLSVHMLVSSARMLFHCLPSKCNHVLQQATSDTLTLLCSEHLLQLQAQSTCPTALGLNSSQGSQNIWEEAITSDHIQLMLVRT